MSQDAVYSAQPTYENELVLLRPLTQADAPALLRCYADPHAVPLFNSDNCHGDDFHYTTLARMQQALAFWAQSYQERQFVRWAVLDASLGEVVGTVEMFHRRAPDADDHAGVLRIDLQSARETRAFLHGVASLCVAHFYEAFEVNRILTKAVPRATERRAALEAAGFHPAPRGLAGYPFYFERN